MNSDKASFFDGIARLWDGWQEKEMEKRLDEGLERLGVRSRERVLDVGCGTGNLTRALLKRISDDGHVTATDISSKMIEVAREKVPDGRVSWHVEDAAKLPFPDGSFNRVICFSVWPHFDDPFLTARELKRLLAVGGMIHVWHLASKETINSIHAAAGEAVKKDILKPAVQTASIFESLGLKVLHVVDETDMYLVTAQKVAG